jgi:hypothetical protein
MIAALACSALLAAAPAVSNIKPSDWDIAAYESARAKAGRDADAHVRLALWCEAHGMSAERARHLALAVLADPGHAAARGLMGLVADGGAWRRPDQVAERARADAKQAAKLAEYNARRAKAAKTGDAQWKLAVWCEENGLEAEAKAHLTAVTRLEPWRDAPWRKLGYRKFGGRWMSPEQIEAAKAERVAQARANERWMPLLRTWKGWLREKGKRAEAEAALAGVEDRYAVPAILSVFARGGLDDQARTVQLLGQIDATVASQALALIAAGCPSPEVRRRASETLRRRDPREYVGLLVAMLRDPVRYDTGLVEGLDGHLRRALLVEGKAYNVMTVFANPVGSEVKEGRLIFSDSWRFHSWVNKLDQFNTAILCGNAGPLAALGQTTGEDLGGNRETWTRYYVESVLGYTYTPEAQQSNQQTATLYQSMPSCFAAGTPVRTRDGLVPIERIRVGDRVLAQDTVTGALGYRPVVVVHRNPPAPTLRVGVGDEAIVSTVFHRFWRAGKGWAMARDLKPGDVVRTVGGTAEVSWVVPGGVQPVFNLDVADSRDFFVGNAGALVHDNSVPAPRGGIFDAPPPLLPTAGAAR